MARTRSRYLSTTIGVAERVSTTVISPAANRSSASRSSPFLPATTIARTPGNDASGSTPSGFAVPRPRAAASGAASVDAGGAGVWTPVAIAGADVEVGVCAVCVGLGAADEAGGGGSGAGGRVVEAAAGDI